MGYLPTAAFRRLRLWIYPTPLKLPPATASPLVVILHTDRDARRMSHSDVKELGRRSPHNAAGRATSGAFQAPVLKIQ